MARLAAPGVTHRHGGLGRPPTGGACRASSTKEVTAMLIGAAVSALLGFGAGFFSFKVKSRWCPECGAWTKRTQSTRTVAQR